MKPQFDLTGKTALITGSSQGIGKAMALAFAKAGANIIVHGTHSCEKLDETVAEIEAIGGNVVALTGNFADSAEVKKLVGKAKATFDGVDILVLNASVQAYMTLDEFDEKEFQFEYDVNLKASFEMIRGLLPNMKKNNWGRVLTIGSVNQWKPSPRLPIYSTTKSAQVNLIMNCAREYSKYGITFNNLAPGVITTGRNVDTLADEATRLKLLDMIPANRLGSPEDCAGPALMLCSETGSYITGADIPVTGGMHL